MGQERLDKIIASMGQYSRKDVKKLVREGNVTVDGIKVKNADMKCDPDEQIITVSGKPLSFARDIYLMLHKPGGVVTSTRDQMNRTVMDLLPSSCRRKDLFPVGRLDKDTEGLLLITNDGELAHKLLSPGRHVDKEYFVTVEGILNEDAVRIFADGVVLADGSRCLSAVLKILSQKTDPVTGVKQTDATVIIQEGMYHQIKRMFGTLGFPVMYLKRLRMGSLVLDESLLPGEVRALTQEELDALRM